MIVNRLKMSVAEQAEFELMNSRIASIAENLEEIAHKSGYVLVHSGTTEAGSELYEYNKSSDENQRGDYTNPIQYVKGDEIEKGKFYWYSDFDIRQEALKDGIPKDFYDAEYFDVIPM